MEKNKPILIIIAGPNGSGKTSVTSQILRHEWVVGCVYINPDSIAQDELGDWNSPQAVLQAAQIAELRRENCLKNKESLIFETVFSAPDKLDFLKRAKEIGYFIRLFFVGTDEPTINASRVARRVIDGGHDVPISKIVSRYYKSMKMCGEASKLVDRLYVYDNSVDFAPVKLLFRAVNGQVGRTYGDINKWALPILKKIK